MFLIKQLKPFCMKKITFSLLVALLFSMNMIQAQDQKTFVLGLNFSPSIDWMTPSSDGYTSDGVMLGYSYGIDMDFSIAHSSRYFVHTGIQLKRAGGRLSYKDILVVTSGKPAEYVELSRKYNIDYLRIPAAFKLKTNQFGRFTFYGMFGLDFDIRTQAKANDEYKNLGTSKEKIKINNNVSLFRAGLLMGAGTEYTISGNTKAYGGIHFSNGFTDVLTGSNVSGIKENALAKYVELTVGFLF